MSIDEVLILFLPQVLATQHSENSLHAWSLSHALHSGHDVVGSLEILEDAVLELALLSRAELTSVMGALECALTANGHHSVDKLSVAFHCDSLLIHVYGFLCGPN